MSDSRAGLLEDPFYFKSIRADDSDFWGMFVYSVTKSKVTFDNPEANLPLRKAKKSEWGIRVDGVYEVGKSPLFSAAEKQFHSKHQSFSYANPSASYLTPVFGHRRRRVLTGVVMGIEGNLIQRIFSRDSGTVNRPYQYQTKEAAETEYKKKLGKLYFNSLEALVESDPDADQVNEVMVRARWSCATDEIGIFNDGVGSRALAQVRAIDFQRRLHKMHEENGEECKHCHQRERVPIVFYSKRSPKKSYYSLETQNRDYKTWQAETFLASEARYLTTILMILDGTLAPGKMHSDFDEFFDDYASFVKVAFSFTEAVAMPVAEHFMLTGVLSSAGKKQMALYALEKKFFKFFEKFPFEDFKMDLFSCFRWMARLNNVEGLRFLATQKEKLSGPECAFLIYDAFDIDPHYFYYHAGNDATEFLLQYFQQYSLFVPSEKQMSVNFAFNNRKRSAVEFALCDPLNGLLYCAAVMQNESMAKKLLRLNADPNVKYSFFSRECYPLKAAIVAAANDSACQEALRFYPIMRILILKMDIVLAKKLLDDESDSFDFSENFLGERYARLREIVDFIVMAGELLDFFPLEEAVIRKKLDALIDRARDVLKAEDDFLEKYHQLMESVIEDICHDNFSDPYRLFSLLKIFRYPGVFHGTENKIRGLIDFLSIKTSCEFPPFFDIHAKEGDNFWRGFGKVTSNWVNSWCFTLTETAAYIRMVAVLFETVEKGVLWYVKAVFNAMPGSVDELLKVKKQSQYSLVTWAAYSGEEAVVEFLKSKGANIAFLNEERDEMGNTALMKAVSANNMKGVRRLIACGADVHAVNHNGDTVMHRATRTFNNQMMAFLLESGASDCVNQKDNNGKTPVDILASCVPGVDSLYLLIPSANQETIRQSYDRSLILQIAPLLEKAKQLDAVIEVLNKRCAAEEKNEILVSIKEKAIKARFSQDLDVDYSWVKKALAKEVGTDDPHNLFELLALLEDSDRLKKMRERAYQALKDQASTKDDQAQLALWRTARNKPLFNLHRNHSIFVGAWGRTRTVAQIDRQMLRLTRGR